MATTAAVPDQTIAPAHRDAALNVRIFDSLPAAEPVWRDLEARGIYSPYQRFDWIRFYLQAGFEPRADLAILVLSHDERPAAILPFRIERRFGLRIARIIGMPISNGDGLVFDPALAHTLTPRALRAALRELPADIVSFHCVAPQIGLHANPLIALGGDAAPDNLYVNELVPGDAPYIEQSLPHKRRANIRRSQRRLEENFGPVRLHRAETPQEIEETLAVFLDQRGRRFVQMGVENIFARPPFRQFFRDLAVESLDQRRPALSVHALYAGERIVATSIGTFGPGHYSQYINSTDYGEAARFSLMGVALSLLVDELRADKIATLDMGLGDFDYKMDWTHRQTVFDIVLPVSVRGRVAAPLLRTTRRIKRSIKQTPALWRIARAVRAALVARRRHKSIG